MRRKFRLWSLGLAGAVFLAGFGLFEISKARCFSLVGEAVCRVETRQKVVALSFDDGPTAEGVAWATAQLRRTGARATFFLIGEQVAGREMLVRRIVATGNEVGNHSFSHSRMVLHRAAFYDREIERTDALLRQSGVRAPRLFRPPYGKKLIGLPRALARHGYEMVLWDVEDPARPRDARDYADRLLREVRPGSIILMHIMYRGNHIERAALPLVLQGLAARVFRVVTVGELLSLRD